VAWLWIALIDILAMLGSGIYILWLSLQEKLNIWEVIGLRVAFTIYCAWLVAATLLNTAIALKASGVSDETLGSGVEEQFAMAILWVAWAVYIASSWW